MHLLFDVSKPHPILALDDTVCPTDKISTPINYKHCIFMLIFEECK